MKQKLSSIFKQIDEIQPSIGLRGVILAQVGELQLRKSKKKLWFSYGGLVSSVLLVIFSMATSGRAILDSDFWEIVNLIFFDLGIVVENWKVFGISLLENFPVFNVIFVLFPLGFFFWSFGTYYEIVKRKGIKRIGYSL